MKKYIVILSIIFLISFTTLVKNASKDLENKIYNKKENIIILERDYSLVLLENNYLSSPKKLFSYSDNIKKENYYPTDITNFNKIEFTEDKIKIEKFISNE